MEFYDVHTHQILLEENDDPYHSCIFDVYPLEFEVAKDSHRRHAFSCGIHPWYSEGSETQMTYLTEIAPNPRIVAIGETGIDRLKYLRLTCKSRSLNNISSSLRSLASR